MTGEAFKGLRGAYLVLYACVSVPRSILIYIFGQGRGGTSRRINEWYIVVWKVEEEEHEGVYLIVNRDYVGRCL